ncbi:MAG: DUF1343 domain-containing protein [Deltaproteobacteria bacterium]|nr:DUF1343 domain-containing protein [Deltaproteobacteria bacterium]
MSLRHASARSDRLGAGRAQARRLAAALLTLALVRHVPVRARTGVDAAPATDAAKQAPAAWLQGIDRLVADALARQKLPGCVIAVGRRSGVVYSKAFGLRALLPDKEAMTQDTIFDVASLTKPVATAASVMVLVDQGKLDLDERAARYLPGFAARGKAGITLRQLLTHVSGLPSEIPVADCEGGRAEAWKRIVALRPKAAPGERFIYSDVGYIVLDEIVRHVAGKSSAAFADAAIYRPLGMADTGFLPAPGKRPRIAPTEQRHDEWMRGEVHDPRAFRMGGVAGHAGLFSTAADLARFARMVLGEGALEQTRVLSVRGVANMLAPHDVPGGIRALGWDIQTAYSTSRGSSLSRRAVGHGGYTGTSLWIDPERDLFVILLGNRVHPDGKGATNDLAAAIATLVGTALAAPAVAGPSPAGSGLALGIDVLAAEDFARLRGLRLALLTNDSARDRDGRRTTDVLADRRGFKLVALLSPEHGLSARRDERIDDGRDVKTRLPIHSLYGGAYGARSGRPAGPRPVTLPPGIDAVVVDLPDVGTRFFTYASSVHATMRAAARRGLRVILLDRPNPIGGIEVSGPVLETSELSPVNHHVLPVRHGMTMAELAEMMNSDEHLGLRLDIVHMASYRRSAYHDETGLPWRPPSPNLRTVSAAVLYPALGLLEATNVTVGRGTPSPFEVLGAPWIDGAALAAELASAELAGVAFETTEFIPRANPHRGIPCSGIRVRVTNRTAFEPVRTGIAIALALRKLFPAAWNTARLRGMLGDPEVATAIVAGRRLPEIEALWQSDLDKFRAKRLKYLLYPP